MIATPSRGKDAPAPDVDGLREALRWLAGKNFSATSRLPLFAARHWSPALERSALSRFRRGCCNVEEVAVPRWYWRSLEPSQLALFEALSLARPQPGWAAPLPLRALLGSDGSPAWRLVYRYSRCVLQSLPKVSDDSLVYFGDDTLFLMKAARHMLESFGESAELRVLDLCCGGGGVGLALPPFRGELVGVDINLTALDLARRAAQAQSLSNYHYLLGDARLALDRRYDLIVGNPPTLPPDLVAQPTLYATGASASLLSLLEPLLESLSPRGRALLTVFSSAAGEGDGSRDDLRIGLAALLDGRRGHRYTVRRQFPLAGGRWLRHVALEIFCEQADKVAIFENRARGGIQLPALPWRRQGS